MLGILQRQLIYFPSQDEEKTLLSEARRWHMREWRDPLGKIIGWTSRQKHRSQRRMLMFHGNAGYALHRVYFSTGLERLGDWDVFLFEYPGYGSRDGKPSADAIKTAAEEALALLLATDSRPVYVAGESLGSGVACHLAGRHPGDIAGVFLITPFTSLADVASHHYPFLPVGWLLRERFDCVSDLAGYRGPLAVLIAGHDEIVPASLGQSLYQGYKGPKWLHVDPDAGHNTLNYDPDASWWRQMSEFLSRQL